MKSATLPNKMSFEADKKPSMEQRTHPAACYQ